MDLLQQFSDKYMKEEAPSVRVGDTVRVHIRVKEGSRERIQVFEGTVIAKKHGGIEESLRRGRGEGVPPACSHHREGGDRPQGQGPPRQAVLSARPRGQGR